MPALNLDTIDDPLLFERMESFAGGQDDYRNSTLIDPDQCQRLVNVIIRDNYEAGTRPGAGVFVEPLEFSSVRSLIYFDTPLRRSLVAVCGGKLGWIEGRNGTWTDTGWAPSATDIPVALAQGVDTVLISDGVKAMAIMAANGTVTECGTDALVDPPVGATVLCWHTGRMFAAGFGGERDTVWVSNRLAFGNGQWNSTTRSFRIGSGDGDPIVALHSMQGSTLAVFKQNSIWLCLTDPTAEPPDFQAATVVESLGFGVGCVGKKAVAAVANDVFFMAQDGVRSLQRMQAAAGQWQLSAPLSQPVQRYINRINWDAGRGIAAVSYREFVLFAVPLDSSAVNDAVLVFNTRLGRWLGCWTGWTPAAWVKARFTATEQLIFGNSAGGIWYWKDGEADTLQTTYEDAGEQVNADMWTRTFQFGEVVNSKSGYNVTIRFSSGMGSAEVSAMMDLSVARVESSAVKVEGDVLGTGRLPFQLASLRPFAVTMSLRSLPSFQELYLRIRSTSGWFRVRNVTVSAFPNALEG